MELKDVQRDPVKSKWSNDMVSITSTIRADQYNFLRTNNINVSKFLRLAIDELINKVKD